MTNNTPSAYFDRAKALQEMILNAQEDLKQLRADALEELGVDDMPKEQAKEIRKDLAEVFAVAKIEVKGEIERRNQAAKMARRKRIAEECGVQLDLLDETPAAPARRMARAAATSPRVRMIAEMADAAGVSPEVKDIAMRTAALSETRPMAAAAVVATVKALAEEGKDAFDPETGEVLDDDEPKAAATSDEQAVMHAGGMSAADYKALGDIPDFLRR
jgi:hypothetical protein